MKARCFVLLLELLLCEIVLLGQQKLVPIMTLSDSSFVPQMTVVPPQQPATVVGEHTFGVESERGHLSHKARRTLRAEQFRDGIDSLVRSRSFTFWPNSMQRFPDGSIHLIYNGYYYFSLCESHVEVHLPVEELLTTFVGVENFDSMEIQDYLLTPRPSGWELSLRISEGGENYLVEFQISNRTGETILNFQTPKVVMRYVGTIRPIQARERR